MKKIMPILVLIGFLLMFIWPKEDISINILKGDNEEVVSKDFIYDHPDTTSFPAVVRSSGKKPVTTEYKGIEMSKLFSSLNIDFSNIKKLTITASDGYRIVLKKEEIDEINNVYLTFERDGEYMKSKKQGGNGPFQLIIRNDPFSQRWIKHVDKIILE